MKRYPDIVERAEKWLASVCMRDATLANFAATLHMIPENVGRCLKNEGRTWLDLLNEERIRRCNRARAANPEITITNLALIAGYKRGRNLYRNKVLADAIAGGG